ncbi:MAG: hypothetical protein ACLRUZ_01890 [Faecalimonas sp.]
MKQPNIFAFLTDLLYATLKVHSAVLTPPFESLEQIDFGLRQKDLERFRLRRVLSLLRLRSNQMKTFG